MEGLEPMRPPQPHKKNLLYEKTDNLLKIGKFQKVGFYRGRRGGFVISNPPK